MFPAKANFNYFVSTMAQYGVYVQPYVDIRLFDIPDTSDLNYPIPGWHDAAVKDRYGNIILWSDSHPGFYDICRSTQLAHDYGRDTCVTLASTYSCKGAYLDQFADIHHDCYDPNPRSHHRHGQMADRRPAQHVRRHSPQHQGRGRRQCLFRRERCRGLHRQARRQSAAL